MDTTTVVSLIKARLGVTATVRDTYLTVIADSVIKELEDEKGLVLDGTSPYHLMFVVDYATWRYQNKDSDAGVPRHLRFRLHNLMIHVGSANLRVDEIETVDVLPADPSSYTVYILSTDGGKQMYISDVWTEVNLVDGQWVVIAA